MSNDPGDRWRTLDALFGEAVARKGGERDAFLDRACADQPELRAAVRRALASEVS